MRFRLLTLFALITWTTTAHAAPPPALPMKMLGSDTLREVTREVIESCDLTSHIDYQGTGSSNGGAAMKPQGSAGADQQIAPQSRFLNGAECAYFGSSPQLGQGITVGLDGIGVMGDDTETTGCKTLRYSSSLTVTEQNGVSGVQCPNCSGSQYAFSDWRDVLRIVYAGQSAHINQDPCSDADPSRVPAAIGGTPPTGCGNGVVAAPEQCDDGNTTNFDGCASNCTWEIGHASRCNSDLRRSLVANFGSLFQGGCTDPECAQLRHAFRRDDFSGTTDTFLTLLGLPSATGRTFCNGFEVEDLDPIRRACDPNEQVCATVPYASRNANPHGGNPTGNTTDPGSAGGDLGLVLAVSMPADLDKQFSPDACGFGRFALAPMPSAFNATAQRCPDCNGRTLGLCRVPITAAASGSKYSCLATKTTVPPLRTCVNMDGRAYNLIARDPDTGALLNTQTGINDPRWGGGAHYRIHQTTAMSNADSFLACSEADATQQLGCLVTASPCSIAYAGREALYAGFNKAFMLRSPLSDANHPAQQLPLEDVLIRRLLDVAGASNNACGQGPGNNFGYRYPLARRLWINSARGFGLPSFSAISDTVTATNGSALASMEKQLAICMADRSLTDQAIVDNGFITITDRNCSAGICDPDELAIGYRARSCSPRCGDGIRQPPEGCDDGNAKNGDGCSASCTVE